MLLTHNVLNCFLKNKFLVLISNTVTIKRYNPYKQNFGGPQKCLGLYIKGSWDQKVWESQLIEFWSVTSYVDCLCVSHVGRSVRWGMREVVEGKTCGSEWSVISWRNETLMIWEYIHTYTIHHNIKLLQV